MTGNLILYLELERLSLACDEDTAEQIRDVMEPIWYRLTPEEVKRLDDRGQLFISGRIFTGTVGIKLPLPVAR